MNIENIIFRGKTVKDYLWVEGYFVACIDETDPERGRIPEIVGLNADHIYTGEYSCGNTYEVIPETVGMWTGCKDKNGRMIYEDDIVKSDWGYKGIVDFEDFMYSKLESCISEDIEVIGNIWDDPDLAVDQ